MARLSVHQLTAGDAVEVVRFKDAAIGAGGRREPHRHDYHELIWVSRGTGEHSIDGQTVPVVPGSVTVIGRGQVHVFEHAERLDAAVVRFGDELLHEPGGRRAAPGWLLAGRGGRTVSVPPSEAPRLDAVIASLAAEAARPPDPYAADAQRHLLALLLLWIERWYDATRTEPRDAGGADVTLHRRFTALLERDHARHRDAAHYADALAVPPAALSRALQRVTGRTTKELVLDRVLTEAARLLRYTDLSAGEIAHTVGYDDPLYFSRAFKRWSGQAPTAYRARARGR